MSGMKGLDLQKKAGVGNAWASARQSGQTTSNKSDLGEVGISAGVMTMLARTAILGVPGVAALRKGFAGRVAAWLGADLEGSGIKVTMNDDGVSIEARILVEYGARVHDVVRQIQNDVRDRITEITGKRVKTVNVIVHGIVAPSGNTREDQI